MASRLEHAEEQAEVLTDIVAMLHALNDVEVATAKLRKLREAVEGRRLAREARRLHDEDA